MDCQHCGTGLAGTNYRLAGVEAMWYRCRPCHISYAIPIDQGPGRPVFVARDFALDLVVLGWLATKIWLWRVWRSRWFKR